jgi:hypothetical protein
VGFQEETQLFRTDWFYFHNYIVRPGGISAYFASFLTQFYAYPALGCVILSLFVAAVYLLLIAIFKRNGAIHVWFVFPFVVPVFLLISCADVAFRLSCPLSLSLVCASFWLYLLIKSKLRFVSGIALYIIVYFIAGGNVLLLVFLILIDELFNKKRSFGYMGGLAACALLLPYVAHRLIYVTPLETAYFCLTPFDPLLLLKAYRVAWITIPCIYLIWRWQTAIQKKSFGEAIKPWKLLVPYVLFIGGITIWGVKAVINTDAEIVSQIAYEAEHGNWDKVLELGRTYKSPENFLLVTFYMNIAYSERGTLLSEMFYHRQIGTPGLFLYWSTQYEISFALSELYYRLGIIPEAEHCAYEAMENRLNEAGAKTLRRLVYTNMIRRDTPGFEKYIGFFERSPLYHQWALQQRAYYEQYKDNPSYEIPGLPKTADYLDFFINNDMPEYNLIVPLRKDVHNKKLFEYLIAAIMLKKDMPTLLKAMKKYYPDMAYSRLPRHLEEALVISKYLLEGQEDSIDKYPIRQETIDRFMQYARESEKANNTYTINRLGQRYGNTFWYYMQFIKPVSKENEKPKARS